MIEGETILTSSSSGANMSRETKQEVPSTREVRSPTPTTSSGMESVENTSYDEPDIVVDATSITDPEILSGGAPLKPWQSAFLRRGPLAGILSLCIAILGIFASLGILAASNATPVTSWSAPPSTYLAIFTAIANLSMRYACIQGVVIAWWHRALRGTTLAQLHYDWRAGTTFPGALSSGRKIGLLGLACLASNFVVIDGPLLQRSSTVVIAPLVDNRTRLNVSIAPEIPSSFSGTWVTNAEEDTTRLWSMGFNDTVPDGTGTTSNRMDLAGGGDDITVQMRISYMLETSLNKIVTGCEKTCKAKIQAPAFAVTACQNHSFPVNYTRDSHSVNEIYTNADKFIAPSLNEDGIITALGLEAAEIEKAYLFTGFFDGSDCVGTFNYTACTLQSAIGEYDVTIDRGVLSLVNAAYPTIVALANNTQVDRHSWKNKNGARGHPSTLAGILSLANLKWDSTITFAHQPGDRSQIAAVLTDSPATTAFQRPNDDKLGLCQSFSDPHDEVLKDMNELMVRAGAILASQDSSMIADYESRTDPGTPSFRRTITGYRTGDHDLYHTNYMYYLGAALVEVLCVAVVAPLYWGWWKLGRHMSFSPLEIAKVRSSQLQDANLATDKNLQAFGSPLLADCNSNCSGRELAKSTGSRSVRYGAARPTRADGTRTLGFADSSTVEKPARGMQFDV